MPAPPQVPAQVWGQRALTLGIVFPSVTPGILPALPELGPQAPVDFKGPMRAGAGESALTSPPDVEPGTPYLATQVEVQVGIAQGSPMPKYPNILRSSGMEGSARFRFVVDTLGHVEMGTVEQILTSHEAFSVAVRSTLPRMRFTPATVGGRPVRQLVELPIIFKIQR
jgi:protein TonB